MNISERDFNELYGVWARMVSCPQRDKLNDILYNIRNKPKEDVEKCDNKLCGLHTNLANGCFKWQNLRNCDIYKELHPIKEEYHITVPMGLLFHLDYKHPIEKNREGRLDEYDIIRLCESDSTLAYTLGITCKLVKVKP